MFEADDSDESLDETLRSLVREVSRSIERIAQLDLDAVAETFGVDLGRARRFADSTAEWLRVQAERQAGDVTSRRSGPREAEVDRSSLPGAGPHPLDLPTDGQGLALAAVDSGRWTVAAGGGALVADGGGPPSSDAPGLLDELRARDWITADGEITLVGRSALSRWVEAAGSR